MKGNLLITGASGFLGFHLIAAALSKNYTVFAGVRKSSQTLHLQQANVQVVALDLKDKAGLKQALQQHGITHIIHAAALTRAKTEADYNFSNAELTRNLAEAAMAAGGLQKFVFISSLAAIGPSHDGRPVNDTDPPHPLTWYGKSKLLAEQYLRNIPNLPLIGLRPTAVFGPREKDLLLLVKSVSRGMEVYIGGKAQALTFVYVTDLARLAIDCLAAEINGAFYNISDGKLYNRYAFADAVKKALGRKTLRLQLPMPLIRVVAGTMDLLYRGSSKTPVLNTEKLKELTAPSWSCNIDNAVSQLGFAPEFDLESGMAETVKWYKANRWI